MHEFQTEAMALSSSPEPEFKGLSKSQRYMVLAPMVQRDADLHRRFAERVVKLNPPPEYKAVNEAAYALFSKPAELTAQIASELRAGRKPTHRLSESNDLELECLAKLVTEVERVEGPKSGLREQIEELRSMLNSNKSQHR